MKKYTTQNHINNLFKNAINKQALKEALNDPTKRKEILNILQKVRY